jgi:hypothetical protein
MQQHPPSRHSDSKVAVPFRNVNQIQNHMFASDGNVYTTRSLYAWLPPPTSTAPGTFRGEVGEERKTLGTFCGNVYNTFQTAFAAVTAAHEARKLLREFATPAARRWERLHGGYQ